MTMQKATFAAGCFWGVEAAFRQRLGQGVTDTAVGYIGGHVDHPTYQQVCSYATGHAETVEVTFDPSRITYEELLDIFWSCHDPTQKNRQGPDVGSQYRSVVFYHDDQQKQQAEASRAAQESSCRFSKPIATEIAPATTFWRAEDYHQQYLEKRGQAACPSSSGGAS